MYHVLVQLVRDVITVERSFVCEQRDFVTEDLRVARLDKHGW